MSSREDLHKLVDSLPDASLQAAEQTLTRFQTWPPSSGMPPELERLREESRQRYLSALKDKGQTGMISGSGGGGNFNPQTRSGSSSQTHWEGDTLVVQTHHYHKGHVLSVVQSIRLSEDNNLIYKHEISGPGNKSGQHEVTFKLEPEDSGGTPP